MRAEKQGAWTLRAVTAADFSTVRELENQLLAFHAQRRGDVFQYREDHYTEAAFHAMVDPAENICLLAEVDGLPAGMCLSKVTDPARLPMFRSRRVCMIEDLAVHPAFRRRGLATALVEETRRRARAAGCESYQITVWACNREAASLYEALGFTPQRTVLEQEL